MNQDELLLLGDICAVENKELESKKESLLTVVVSGKSRAYLGKQYTMEDIDALSCEDLVKLHAKYENYIGSLMTRDLGKSLVSLYTKAVSHFFPVDDDSLCHDLESNPIVSNSIGKLACTMYYMFGGYLAPVVAVLITSRHVDFSKINFMSNENGGQSDNPRPNLDTGSDSNQG
jgi:hypothetical protein